MSRVYTPGLEDMIVSSQTTPPIKSAQTRQYLNDNNPRVPKEMISIKSPFLEEGEEIVVPEGTEEDIYIGREDVQMYQDEDFQIEDNTSREQITESFRYPQGYVTEREERKLLEEVTDKPTIDIHWWFNNQNYEIYYDPLLNIDEIKMELEKLTGIPTMKQHLLNVKGEEILYGTLQDNQVMIGDRLLLL